MIIEGDNLEVLKLLQKGYQGKVKMIYIDPPYNTGNDFIYPGRLRRSLENYLQYTGQADSDGKASQTILNPMARFHSKWLNMMYPRLYLARNLLRDDGVIFISIDDEEIEYFRKLCDSVFGDHFFLANFVLEGVSARECERIPDSRPRIVSAFARDLEQVKLVCFNGARQTFLSPALSAHMAC